MYAICKSQPAWFDHNIFDLTLTHFDGYCMSLHIIMLGHPLAVLPLCNHPHAPACHHLPLVSPEHSNDGEEEPRALDGSEHFSQKPHYIHDDMIDAPPWSSSEHCTRYG
jgi:hypothetical protein